jgi:hypothetical protein
MKRIKVVYYGYKSKMLYDAVRENSHRASKTSELITVVFDQINLERRLRFKDICNLYHHIKWDTLDSRFSYRQSEIKKNDYDYILMINDALILDHDWDIKLMSAVDDKSIVSGFNKINFDESDIRFYPNYKIETNESFTETSWVSNSFIFGKKETIQLLPDIGFLKDKGEEEFLSLSCFVNDIKIFAMPSNFVDTSKSTYNTQDYYAFSRRHNYAKVIDMFQGKSDILPEISCEVIEKFSEIHKYDFSKLHYFPYSINDIKYQVRMEIDDIGEERFFLNINKLK